MLTYCLALNNKKQELIAYDLIGFQYFYLGQLEKAHFFHCKMNQGDLESSESYVRKLGKQKYLN